MWRPSSRSLLVLHSKLMRTDSSTVKTVAEPQYTSSADADKPARRVQRSVKVNKHGTIRYVGMVSYQCAIVTLTLRSAVFEIFDYKKCCDLKIRVKGALKSSVRTVTYDFLLTLHSNHGPYTAPFPRETAISVENSQFFATPCTPLRPLHAA